MHIHQIVNNAEDNINAHVEELIEDHISTAREAVKAGRVLAPTTVKHIIKDLGERMMGHLTMNCTCALTVAVEKAVGIAIQRRLRPELIPHFEQRLLDRINA